MSRFTPQQVIEERNKRLMAWLADELNVEELKRQQLYAEMTVLFKHFTDTELAEYLWTKLLPHKLITDEEAKKVIGRFHDIAYGWLSNTAEDRRN